MTASLAAWFNFTLTVSLTALLVLGARAVIRRRARPRLRLALWAVLWVRAAAFLLGVALPASPVSAARLLPVAGESRTVAEAAAPDALPAVSPAPAAESSAPPAPDPPSDALPATPAPSRYQAAITLPGGGSASVTFTARAERAAVGVWLAGAAGLALWFAGSYLVFARRARRCPTLDDPELEAVRRALGIRRRVRLHQSAEGPLLMGELRPRLLIPPGFTGEERRQIYLHELCHLRHHDNFWSILAVALLCLCWYNPLLWLCFRLFKQDLELACDERVLGRGLSRKAYARLLLKALEMQEAPPDHLTE